MSSISNGPRKPRTPGEIDTSANSNLSKIAKHQGAFQGRAKGTDQEDGESNKTHGHKGPHRVKPAGMAGAEKTRDGAKETPTTTTVGSSFNAQGQQPSLLPDAEEGLKQKTLAGDSSDVASTVTTSQAASDKVTAATNTLAKDIADPTTTQQTLEIDLKALKTALNDAGVATPLATVVHDLVDPKGQGTQISANLEAAATASSIDLSVDNVDVKQAQTALQQASSKQPMVQAEVDIATAHLVRASNLAGQAPAADLEKVVTAVSDDSNARAAVFAAAAKAGVDLTQKDEDAKAAAENKASGQKMTKAIQKEAQDKSNAVGGQGRNGGENFKNDSQWGSGTGGDKTQYPDIAKNDSGTSSWGHSTAGDAPIGPNPNNPVDFARDYGIQGGFTSITLDQMLEQLPQLTNHYPNIKEVLIRAANSVNPPIPPQLLVATLGVETSYATNLDTNSYGPYQFSDDDAWAKYGHNGDKFDIQISSNAAAGYFRDLIDKNGGNLYLAMRDYNGSVDRGASRTYQRDQQRIFNGDT